jgi:predicted aconitase with swiveling domain
MIELQGRGVIGQRGAGKALVTRAPINFTAAMSWKNLLPNRRSEMQDRHHELFGRKVKCVVLVFPFCIGSTYTGMLLFDLIARGEAPAAMIVRRADPLLVSGSALAEVWRGRRLPIVEYDHDDLFDRIGTGDDVAVDGQTGLITVRR